MSDQCYNLENSSPQTSKQLVVYGGSFERVWEDSDESPYRTTWKDILAEMSWGSKEPVSSYRRVPEIRKHTIPRNFATNHLIRSQYDTPLLETFPDYQSVLSIADFFHLLPPEILKSIIERDSTESKKEVSSQLVAHSAEFSGRVVRIEGDKVLIQFSVDGDLEEREFSKNELNVTADFLKPGIPVLAVTTLKFLPRARKPTPEEKTIARQEFEQAAERWAKIDIDQVPRIPPIGS